MSAPERIWVEPPYYTLSGKIPDIVWEAHWDKLEAQSFDRVRTQGTEYIRADLVEARIAAAEAAMAERAAEIADDHLARVQPHDPDDKNPADKIAQGYGCGGR